MGYEDAGVRDQSDALLAVRRYLQPTLSFPHEGQFLTDFGHYAAVIRIRDDLAIAISTDGVGSKTVVASAVDRYDTIGFDCMAMNVNDLVCVGARPLAMVDYIGVHELDGRRIEEILQGLGGAAKEAGVAVPGGELAQLPDVIGSSDDPKAFDLVGTCVGTLHPDDLIAGDGITPGDLIVGLPSSGLHSNGFTLARRIFSEAGLEFDDHVPELATTLGEELLRPTEIYVRPILSLWNEGIQTKGLAHITGDGLLNLCRFESPVGYEIETLPELAPIFDLIKRLGGVDWAEMYRVFNMGVGFVLIVGPSQIDAVLESLSARGHSGSVLGRVSDERGLVRIKSLGIEGDLESGFRSST